MWWPMSFFLTTASNHRLYRKNRTNPLWCHQYVSEEWIWSPVLLDLLHCTPVTHFVSKIGGGGGVVVVEVFKFKVFMAPVKQRNIYLHLMKLPVERYQILPVGGSILVMHVLWCAERKRYLPKWQFVLILDSFVLHFTGEESAWARYPSVCSCLFMCRARL